MRRQVSGGEQVNYLKSKSVVYWFTTSLVFPSIKIKGYGK